MSDLPTSTEGGKRSIWVSVRQGYPEEGGGEDGYYESEEAAVRHLRARYNVYDEDYQKAYLVTWREERDDRGVLNLIGEFEDIPGFCVGHTAVWRIYEEEVKS